MGQCENIWIPLCWQAPASNSSEEQPMNFRTLLRLFTLGVVIGFAYVKLGFEMMSPSWALTGAIISGFMTLSALIAQASLTEAERARR
jgi:hypothetical protein